MQSMLAQLVIRLIAGRHGSYQPVMVAGRVVLDGRRWTEKRVAAILPELEAAHVCSVVDYGCAEGYVVRHCAERGWLALGVEQSRRAVALAQISMLADNLDGFGLVRGWVTPDLVRRMPKFDATVSLSMLHHTMYTYGLEYARELMSEMAAATNRLLVFEMGQSNEAGFSWSSRLPDMGAEPQEWLAEFLESCGFVNPRVICKVPSFNSDVERVTFVARAPSQ